MTLTKSPQPAWADFLGPGNESVPGAVAWTLNGRNALFLALGALGLAKGARVLIPSFHCTALVDPVLAYGAKPVYYPIGKDFAPDMQALARLVRQAGEGGAAALVSIHYFGFPSPVEEISALCAASGVLHIEDCCHALLGRVSGGPLGGFGDAAIFSFRKTFPVQDGGALRLRIAKKPAPSGVRPPLTYQLRMAKWTLDALRAPAPVPVPSGESAPATSPPLKADFSLSKGPVSHEDPAFAEPLAPWRASWISRWLIAKVDGRRVVERRRSNYLRLQAALEGTPRIRPCFGALPEGTCPMAFPILVDLPFRLDYRLRAQGIPAFSFGETLSADMDLGLFPEAVELSRKLVLLPVHQGLGSGDMDRMAAAVKETTRG